MRPHRWLLAICLTPLALAPAQAGTLRAEPPSLGLFASVTDPPDVALLSLFNDFSTTQVTGVTFGSGCDEFGVFGNFPTNLANGESMNLDIFYDPVDRGLDTCTVTPTTGFPQGDGGAFTLSGFGLAAQLSVGQSQLAFSDQRWNGGTPQTLSVTFMNVGNEPIEASDVSVMLASGTHFTIGAVTGLPLVVSGDVATIPVTFDPTSAGPKTDTLVIALANDLPAEPNGVVNLTGTGTQSTQTFRATSPFLVGSTLAGNTTSRALEIGNTGDATLNLTGSPAAISIAGAQATEFAFTDHGCSDQQQCNPEPATVQPGAAEGFRIRCTPAEVGERIATLTVRSDDPQSPRALTLTCVGLADAIFANGFE